MLGCGNILYFMGNTMLDTNKILSLSDVEKTLVIPLWARAEETLVGGLIEDRLSVELVETLDLSVFNFQQLSPFIKNYLLTAIANRTIIIDDMLKKLDGKGRTVLNFGCGMDTRFSRFESKFDMWYDIDLEPVIELRRQLIDERDGYRMITGDITSESVVPKQIEGENFIVVCEGLLMYFTHNQVMSFLNKMTNELEKGDLIFESLGSYAKIKVNPVIKGIGEKSKYKWGMNNICKLEEEIPYLRHRKTVSIFDINKSRWGVMVNLMRVNYLKKRVASKISHFSYEHN